MDFNKELRRLGNRTIVNKDVIEHPDRDIDNVILNCYSNLNHTKLLAYSMDYADVSTEFYCTFKSQVDKLSSKFKDKLKDNNSGKVSSMKDILKEQQTEESIDVKNLHNNYKILKLKYMVDPDHFIDPNDALAAVERTLDGYSQAVSGYQVKVENTYEYLLYLKDKYNKMIEKGEFVKSKPQPDNDTDLFVDEQLLLLPVYEGDSKYIINGIKYYGLFNNCESIGILSNSGQYGVKVFKDGNIFSVYLVEKDDVFYIRYYGEYHNIIYALTYKNGDEINDYREIFGDTDDPDLERKFETTLKHFKMIESDPNHPDLANFIIDSKVPDMTKVRTVRPIVTDKAYISQIMSGMLERYKIQKEGVKNKERKFEFLGNLEEAIYKEINGSTKIKKNLKLKQAKGRINLYPSTILKTIGGASREHVANILFVSTSTEPNPFDIFYLFGFMRSTQHTMTSEAKTQKGVALPDREKLIKYDDFLYLGEFSPKSENNIGKSTTLRFGISSDVIMRRKRMS